ncbi:MAG: NAD-dependent epimerase/dehydratase family protein [Chloroflexota bacterium]
MKALVTGATGFLGSHIAERLVQRGEQVRALVRPTSRTSFLEGLGVEIVRGDVTDAPSLPAALSGVDVVYHAAAMVSDWAAWDEFKSVTIGGTRNMLKAARDANVGRFLYVSTDGVYRYQDLRHGVTEETPMERHFGAFDYYRRSKTAAERIVRKYMERGDLPVTIVRPALILGERDAAMLPGVIQHLSLPGSIYLGSGRNRLPIVYAGDVAELSILAATNLPSAGQTYNAVNEEYVTQRDLFAITSEEAGVPSPKRSLPFRAAYTAALAMELSSRVRGWSHRPSLTRFSANLLGIDYVESSAKAGHELGWKPEVGYREAVRRSVEWSRRRRAQPISG